MGEFRIVNPDTGYDSGWVRNRIKNHTLLTQLDRAFRTGSFSSLTRVARIAASASTDALTILDRANDTLPDTIAVGSVPVGSDRAQYIQPANGDPAFIEILNTVLPTGVERTINSLGMTSAASNNDLANVGVFVYAASVLDEPCVQDPTSTLNLFYRLPISNDRPGQGGLFPSQEVFAMQAWLDYSGVSNVANIDRMYFLNFGVQLFPVSDWEYLTDDQAPIISTQAASLDGNPSTHPERWTSYERDDDLFLVRLRRKIQLDRYVGQLLGWMIKGRAGENNPLYPNAVLGLLAWDGSDSLAAEVGSVFGHSPTNTVPFFDPLQQPSGSGSVVVSLGSWSGTWPEYYRLTIEQGGAAGTATYRVRRRVFLAFDGNTFTDLRKPNIYGEYRAVGSAGLDADLRPHLVSTDTPKVIRYSATKVSRYDLFDGTVETLATPGLTATNIRQVEIDPSNPHQAYIACEDTGLWLADFELSTVTQLSTDPCLGVDFAATKAFAIFGGTNARLSSSDDWAAALPFTHAGITDNNWDTVRFLKCSHDTDGKIGIAATDWVWVDATDEANIVTTIAQTNIAPFTTRPEHVGVARTLDFWVMGLSIGGNNIRGLRIYTHNQSLTSAITLPSNLSGQFDYYTAQTLMAGDLFVTRLGRQIINNSGAVVDTLPANLFEGDTENVGAHLGDGVCVNNGTLASFSDAFEVEYGWDGSNWVEGESANKVTHVGAEAIPGGLLVSFVNGASSPEFVAGESYTTTASNGHLCTNATQLTTGWDYCAKPMTFDNATSGAVPATAPFEIFLPASTDPEFVGVDARDRGKWEITVDAVPASYIFENDEVGSPAATGEVKIFIDGRVEFFSGDASKAYAIAKYPTVFHD